MRGDREREPIHGTSYHDAVIRLACDLYERLASVWLQYAKVDIGPCFDDDGALSLTDVPEYQNFAEYDWPARFARRLMDEARLADPIVDVGLFETELRLEYDRGHSNHTEALLQLLVSQPAAHATSPTGANPPEGGKQPAVSRRAPGRKLLTEMAEKDPKARARLNAYELVRTARSALPSGAGPAALIAHFAHANDFKERVREAGGKFNERFFRSALKYLNENPGPSPKPIT